MLLPCLFTKRIKRSSLTDAAMPLETDTSSAYTENRIRCWNTRRWTLGPVRRGLVTSHTLWDLCGEDSVTSHTLWDQCGEVPVTSHTLLDQCGEDSVTALTLISTTGMKHKSLTLLDKSKLTRLQTHFQFLCIVSCL